MSLPGKLCIGILEEDNPLKSYFRFKPLLVEVDGRYVPFDQHSTYPEDGSIRIVPDKNESYHFKARMRRIGLFCVVDLRTHPDDNDKIRTNKNYREGSSERNAFIIYSDVVREPLPGMILEVLPEGAPEALRPRPHTAMVLMRGEALRPETFSWETVPDANGWARLLPTGDTCPTDRLQLFSLEGFNGEKLDFGILPADKTARPHDEPTPKAATQPEDEAVAPSAAQSQPAPVAQPAPAPQPSAERPEADTPKSPAAQSVEPAPASADDKPWLHRDDTMLPRPLDPRLSPAQRTLAIQSGMNPRRGRSLQELIDEKWQQSRMNQLGQPIAPIQTGEPLASPVDSAVTAVRRVWEQPQLRKPLLESLGGIDEFGASLEECRAAARSRDIDRHLDELEARRLALLGELDHLTLKNADVRQSLMQQLRREEASDLAEAMQRTKAARAEQEKYEKLAGEARAAAQDARKAVDELTGEELEQRLVRFALNEHMLERVREIKGEAEAIPPAAPTLQSIDLNALAVRVMNRFDASGFAITRFEALNLCACAAISPVLILSGPVGTGKTEGIRMLADALGWSTIDRFAVLAPSNSPLADDPSVRALLGQPDAPAMLLLDDANLIPSVDFLRGFGTGMNPLWRLCLTVQDAGCPLPAHTLDRGFTIRLSPRGSTPWRPCPRVACAPEAPAALNLAISESALPAVIETRMESLRTALARRGAAVSRRALDESWRYCALMLGALSDAADPIAVLDRAVAQRLLPSLLAGAPLPALQDLDALLEGLPLSRRLLQQTPPFAL